VVAGREESALVWSRLFYFGLRGLSHCGGWPIGKGFVLVSPMFLWSAWAHSLWWRADWQGRWSGRASVPLLVVGSVNVEGVRLTMALVWSRLCSIDRRRLSHCGVGSIGNGVGRVLPLVLRSAWAQSLWWRADRQGRWSGLASVSLVGVGSVTVVVGR
jgi:hypothetical protein